jgi:hypothetical protein
MDKLRDPARSLPQTGTKLSLGATSYNEDSVQEVGCF